MLTGDLNARTGEVSGHVDDDDHCIYVRVGFDGAASSKSRVSLPKRHSHDTTLNQYGRCLLDLCNTSEMIILNGRTLGDSSGKYTCHEVAGSSVVDYTLVHRDSFQEVQYFHVNDFDAASSDHCIVEFGLKVKLYLNEKKTNCINKNLNISKFKWTNEARENFAHTLEAEEVRNALHALVNDLDKSADEKINGLTNIMLGVANRCLKKKNNARSAVKKKPRWHDDECYSFKKALKSLNKSFTKDPFNRNSREKLFQTKKEYKRLIRAKKRKYKSDILEKLNDLHDNDPSQYWQLLKQLKESQQPVSVPADKIGPDEWARHFSTLLDKQAVSSPSFTDELETQEQVPIFNELNFLIQEEEVKNAIKKLRYGKAIGLDSIANEMMKCGLSVLCTPLTKIFNSILNKGQFPSLWRKDYITPIHKSGAHSDPNNYRGITICSNLGKVFTAVLNNRLSKFVDKNVILKEEQIGFRPGCRTTDHMFILKSLIDKYIKKSKEKLFVCFVDLKKAFDSIWREGMLLKLLKSGIGGNFYNIIKSMYCEVKCTVKTQEGFTSFFKSSIGVKQGEVLSPMLFNLYINDILDTFTDGCDPIKICDRKLNALLYADDLVLISRSEKGLQTCLDNLHSYCNLWKLQVNTSKTKVMVFNKAGRLYRHNFIYANMPLECVRHYKYLGVYFSINGNFTFQKTNQKGRALGATFKLKKTICGENLSPREAIKLFRKCIIPVGLYGSEIWGVMNHTSKEPGQIFEDLPFERVLMMFGKSILGVNKKACNAGIRGELGLFPVYHDIIIHIIDYCRRLQDINESSLLKSIYNLNKKDDIDGLHSWYSGVRIMCDKLFGCTVEHACCMTKSELLSKLKDDYSLRWRGQICKSDGGGKLDLYGTIKRSIHLEKYLENIKNVKHRQAFTKLRISAHPLQIEVGRYVRPKVPRAERYCKLCPNHLVEDEAHFLASCTLLTVERQQLYNTILDSCKHFTQMSDRNKCIFMLTADNIAIDVSKYVSAALEKRKIILEG